MYLKSIFTIRELRTRVLFTLFCLIVYRLGAMIPLPGINIELLNEYFLAEKASAGFSLVSYLDFFAGGAFSRFSIFMLGVVPYISASIIMQLLVVSFPALKRMSEQDGGRKKVQKLTRYATGVIAIGQTYATTFLVRQVDQQVGILSIPIPLFIVIALISVTTGTMFLLWLGDQINMRGIGNGISLIIFAGIVARMPQAVYALIQEIQRGNLNPVYLIFVFILFAAVIAIIIIEQKGQRKIPVFYAKRVVGRKMYGAQNTYIPFKVNPSGVIPVIFASALLQFPQMFLSFGNVSNATWATSLSYFLRPTGPAFLILQTLLIVFFAYFYTQVTLNPVEIAKNIRENGGTIQGVRSDKMEEYFMKILNRIILPGSLFLAFIAVIPILIQLFFNIPFQVALLLGGTSLLIVVGVDLDLISQIEASQKMHHQGQNNTRGAIKSRTL